MSYVQFPVAIESCPAKAEKGEELCHSLPTRRGRTGYVAWVPSQFPAAFQASLPRPLNRWFHALTLDTSFGGGDVIENRKSKPPSSSHAAPACGRQATAGGPADERHVFGASKQFDQPHRGRSGSSACGLGDRPLEPRLNRPGSRDPCRMLRHEREGIFKRSLGRRSCGKSIGAPAALAPLRPWSKPCPYDV